jgi:hypothetical protein
MANDNIGQLKTFRQLLDEEKSIIIPKVQRDYAYGRQEEKVQEVLDGMLTSIIEAIRDDSNNILDFVYGGTYVHKSDKKAGLIPLDGQQRLTTLFLLHFYASLLGDEEGNPIDQKEVEILTKFRYETRQSATEFCTNLIRSIRPNLIKNYKSENNNIKALIVDDALYLSTYDSDPTIMSMLNVLDKIEKKCAELGALSLKPCLWNRLMERRNIEFYKLSLDNFGLTDDLFIKMNARGKKLTTFEIFKSDMIAAIKKVDEKLKDDFSKDMDTKWIDIVWDYTDKTINDKRQPLDITNDADTKYSMLFHNIFRVEYYRRALGDSGLEEQDINSIFKDTEGIISVTDMFETLYSIHKNKGFDDLWYKYFYFSENTVGGDNLIRLFWKQKHSSVFELAMQGELSVPEVVYFYSMYLLYKKGTDEGSMKRCLRIIRNLITANVRAVDARTDKLPSFLVEVKYVVDHNGIDTYYDKEVGLNIDGNVHKLGFIQNVWNEEFAKQNYLSSESYEKLLRYENHQILQCSLSLFMDYCLEIDGLEGMRPIAPLDTTKLFKLLKKFETIYSNDYLNYFHQIRTALLDNEIEYMQYDAYMNRNDKRRYFITKTAELSDFYIKYAQRHNQDSILKILENMPLPSEFLAPGELCKHFDIRDWKYYIAKYPVQSTHQWTRYGIGVWDDFSKYPLDLILLNSSQHSESNLEWMMMTFLLKNVLANDEKYYLDEHGCHPISIKKSASAIQFKQGKWLIECNKDLFPSITSNFTGFIIEKTEDEKITVDFGDNNFGLDYIELGRKLVELLEEANAVSAREENVFSEESDNSDSN